VLWVSKLYMVMYVTVAIDKTIYGNLIVEIDMNWSRKRPERSNRPMSSEKTLNWRTKPVQFIIVPNGVIRCNKLIFESMELWTYQCEIGRNCQDLDLKLWVNQWYGSAFSHSQLRELKKCKNNCFIGDLKIWCSFIMKCFNRIIQILCLSQKQWI